MVYGKAHRKNDHQNGMGYDEMGSCAHNVLIVIAWLKNCSHNWEGDSM